MTSPGGQDPTGTEEVPPLDDEHLQRLQRALELNEQLTDLVETRRAALVALSDDMDFECGPSDTGTAATTPTTSKQSKHKTVSLLPFFRPYFRDAKGLSAPQLYDPDGVDQRLLALLQTPRPRRPWTEEEKQTLLAEVRSQWLPYYTRDLSNKLETLLAEAPDIKPKAFIEEVQRLNSELALAASKNVEPEAWSEVIDWLVVAKTLPADRTAEDAELLYNNELHSSIPTDAWSPEEDRRLVELVTEHGTDWDAIAVSLATGRLPWQCCARYQAEFNSSLRRSGKITGREAAHILAIIEQCTVGSGNVNWSNVSCLIEGRTISQVQHFYRKRKNPTIVRKWIKLEDKMLLAGVKLFGTHNWAKIAQYLPLRNNRQLRERYKHQLGFTQPRKFGHWIEEEDEMILEMSTKYVKTVGGQVLINFPEIQRQYFPNRNVYQVYRRYLYLRRFLDESIYNDPSASPSSQPESGNSLLLSNLTKITRHRQKPRPEPVSLHIKLPDDRTELLKFLVEGKKRLEKYAKSKQFTLICSTVEEEEGEATTEEAQEQGQAESEDAQVVLERGKVQPIAAPPVSSSDLELASQHWEYDQLLTGLAHLNEYRYTTKGVAFTRIDLQTNDIVATTILEMVDPAVRSNLKLQLVPEETQDASTPMDTDDSTDCSACTLDTMRYFLSNCAGFSAPTTTPPAEPPSSNPKSLLPPNTSTAFGYNLLRVMSRSMLCRLAPAEDADVARAQEMILADQQYQELRGLFLALFTWPALLACPEVDTDERIVALFKKTLQKEEHTETQLSAPPTPPEPPKKKIGRPRKRQFYFTTVDLDFTRLRSLQANVLLTNIRPDVASVLTEQYPFTASQYWPAEPRSSLVRRVKLFLDTVWQQVDASFDQLHETTKRKKAKKDAEKAANKANKARIKTPVTTTITLAEPTPPLRRSTRAKVPKVSYSELNSGQVVKQSAQSEALVLVEEPEVAISARAN